MWLKYRHWIIAGALAACFIVGAWFVSPLAACLQAAGICVVAGAFKFLKPPVK
jgi:4-hydroxybenzoate polyprenyltransferase